MNSAFALKFQRKFDLPCKKGKPFPFFKDEVYFATLNGEKYAHYAIKPKRKDAYFSCVQLANNGRVAYLLISYSKIDYTVYELKPLSKPVEYGIVEYGEKGNLIYSGADTYAYCDNYQAIYVNYEQPDFREWDRYTGQHSPSDNGVATNDNHFIRYQFNPRYTIIDDPAVMLPINAPYVDGGWFTNIGVCLLSSRPQIDFIFEKFECDRNKLGAFKFNKPLHLVQLMSIHTDNLY